MKMFEENHRKVVVKTVEEAIARTKNERKDDLNHQNSIDKAEVVKNKDNPKETHKGGKGK